MAIDDFPDRRFLVSARELQAHAGEVLLLDVRPAEDFALGRIAGARHLDLYGISLSDTAEAPLQAFLAIFKTLFGARGV
ncbi:MAG TPA: rhodanese-like domain-containing protein, partial [Burkholderiales bacterium]|nr:rhodanese-like domain-containing protein [Burkholderiales bacterium]